jgi:AbrB family looped-hinge helix DNA binding protein
MKVGKGGQVTIPKEIRDRFGIGPAPDVEFSIVEGAILLRKTPTKLDLAKWKGRCARSFRKLGYSSVDRLIEDMRGR